MSTEESREAHARFAWADRVDERIFLLEARVGELAEELAALKTVNELNETLIHIVKLLITRLDQDRPS